MGTASKIFVLMFGMNIFVYIGTGFGIGLLDFFNFAITGDILGAFIILTFSGIIGIAGVQAIGTGIFAQSGTRYTILMTGALTLLALSVFPISLFTISGMPWEIKAVVGGIFSMMYAFAIFSWYTEGEL